MEYEKVLAILKEIKPELDYETETSLIYDGLLDSFAIVSLVNALNEEFDVEITIGELRPENLNSAEAIAQLVRKLMD